MTEKITLYEAIQSFMGQIAAEYGRIIDEGDPDMPVTISFGGYIMKLKLKDFQKLDKAYMQAFDAKCARSDKKHRGGLFR